MARNKLIFDDLGNARDAHTDEVLFQVAVDVVDNTGGVEPTPVRKLPRTCIGKAAATEPHPFFETVGHDKLQRRENPDGSVDYFTHETVEIPSAVVTRRLNSKSPTLQRAIAKAKAAVANRR
jgi:hypothetical protein